MKRVWNFLQVVAGLALLAAFSLGLVVAFRALSRGEAIGSLAASPTQCAPTPVLNPTYAGTLTPTPKPSEFGTIPPPAPSAKPWPISKTTDLSPDVPTEYKGQVIIFHCDGTFELFLTAGTEVPLQPGDVVLSSASLLHGVRPPEPTTPAPPPTLATSAQPVVTPPSPPTTFSYPAPATLVETSTP